MVGYGLTLSCLFIMQEWGNKVFGFACYGFVSFVWLLGGFWLVGLGLFFCLLFIYLFLVVCFSAHG